MMKLAASLSVLAVVALAGCSTLSPGERSARNENREAQTAAAVPPNVQTQTMAYRAGYGVVQEVREPSASVGGTTSPTTPAPSNEVVMAVRMDDGNTQWVTVDTNGIAFPVGTRVELTQDHRIIRQ